MTAAVLAAGLAVGATHLEFLSALDGFRFGELYRAKLSFDTVFTESTLALPLVIAVGAFSAQFGAAFTLGYALGDFTIGYPGHWPTLQTLLEQDGAQTLQWLELAQQRLPLLIVYGLMAIVAVQLPVATKTLLVMHRFPSGLSPLMTAAVAVQAYAVLFAALVYGWIQVQSNPE